jgi:hypothetical protein
MLTQHLSHVWCQQSLGVLFSHIQKKHLQQQQQQQQQLQQMHLIIRQIVPNVVPHVVAVK